MKGLNRAPSSKACPLHRCYVFERACFMKGIYTASTNSPYRRHAQRSIGLSRARAFSQDRVYLPVSETRRLYREGQILRGKCREEGEKRYLSANPGFVGQYPLSRDPSAGLRSMFSLCLWSLYWGGGRTRRGVETLLLLCL
jgi:hypothetical protein